VAVAHQPYILPLQQGKFIHTGEGVAYLITAKLQEMVQAEVPVIAETT